MTALTSEQQIDAMIFLSQYAATYAAEHPDEKMPMTFREAAEIERDKFTEIQERRKRERADTGRGLFETIAERCEP